MRGRGYDVVKEGGGGRIQILSTPPHGLSKAYKIIHIESKRVRRIERER